LDEHRAVVPTADAVAPGHPAILVEDVSIDFGGRRHGGWRPRRLHRRPERAASPVIDGVSLRVDVGESLGLIGRNGSGKSTLLRAMAGLLPVRSGRIVARSAPVLLGVSATLQPKLTARDNIYLAATAQGLRRQQVDALVDDIAEFAGVLPALDKRLETYSSGMAARLRFSISTSIRPDLLFIDEALNVGDEEFKMRSRARMEQLLDAAGAIVFVSHSMRSVVDLCPRVVWIDDGKVRMDGPAKDVVNAYVACVRFPPG
jgi:teichoic acid transport system ATP-binding protein